MATGKNGKNKNANLTKEEAKIAKKKKRQGQAANAEQRKAKGGLKEYLKGVKIETKKVVWPTRKELVSYTVVVIIACIFFGLLIWGADSAFLTALRRLIGITY